MRKPGAGRRAVGRGGHPVVFILQYILNQGADVRFVVNHQDMSVRHGGSVAISAAAGLGSVMLTSR